MSKFYQYPTVDRLKELLSYDEKTGVLTWKVDKARMASAGSIAGSPNSWGHIVVSIDTYRILAHRIAWAMIYGDYPSSSIDHINRIGSDNRIANLRLVTQSENNLNQNLRSDNSSGYTGIRWNKKARKWVARVKKNGIEYHIGLFVDISDAVAARNKKVAELYPRIPEAIIL